MIFHCGELAIQFIITLFVTDLIKMAEIDKEYNKLIKTIQILAEKLINFQRGILENKDFIFE